MFPTKFDAKAGHEIEWSGIMGFTKSNDPLVGIVSEGQYVSAGYTGHGMPRIFACAEVIAQMIIASKQGKEWKPPSWFPLWYLTPQSKAVLDLPSEANPPSL